MQSVARTSVLFRRVALRSLYPKHPSLLTSPHSMTISSGPDWKCVTPADSTIPPYSMFTKPIQKSPRDEREYRVIQLDNGLKATLIHDPETDKAAASLDVAVGHLNDPVCPSRAVI